MATTDPTPTPAPYAPGDYVVATANYLPTWGNLGMVVKVDDLTPYDVVYYWTRIPAHAPHPYTAAELRPATEEDKAAHHPSWVRFLAEDWEWHQRVEAALASATPAAPTPKD